MIPITARLQNQGDDRIVQPSNNRSVNAEGTRLRRRLSKSFHWDSSERTVLPALSFGAGNLRSQPGQKLPVAADPPVPAAHVSAVAGGIFLVHHDIAQQPCARVTPFDKIVAQDPVLGETSGERPLEGVDFVDPLPDKGAFKEKVLVDIRDSARIGVDARIAPVHARIPRPVCARQAHGNPRLKDAVPGNNTLFAFVIKRTVQRMRHGSHKLMCGIARQLGIRVKGDHVLHVQQRSCIADDEGEAVRRNSTLSPRGRGRG